MTVFTWIGGTSGSWDIAQNWSGGQQGEVPGAADVAIIPLAIVGNNLNASVVITCAGEQVSEVDGSDSGVGVNGYPPGTVTLEGTLNADILYGVSLGAGTFEAGSAYVALGAGSSLTVTNTFTGEVGGGLLNTAYFDGDATGGTVQAQVVTGGFVHGATFNALAFNTDSIQLVGGSGAQLAVDSVVKDSGALSLSQGAYFDIEDAYGPGQAVVTVSGAANINSSELDVGTDNYNGGGSLVLENGLTIQGTNASLQVCSAHHWRTVAASRFSSAAA